MLVCNVSGKILGGSVELLENNIQYIHYECWPIKGNDVHGTKFKAARLSRACEIEAGENGVMEDVEIINGIIASNASITPSFLRNHQHFAKGFHLYNKNTGSPAFDINNRLNKGGIACLVDGHKVTYEDTEDFGQLLNVFAMAQGASDVHLLNCEVTAPNVTCNNGFGAGNAYGTIVKYGGDRLRMEKMKLHGAGFGYGYDRAGRGEFNDQFHLNGTGVVVKDCEGIESMTVQKDAVIENTPMKMPVKII